MPACMRGDRQPGSAINPTQSWRVLSCRAAKPSTYPIQPCPSDPIPRRVAVHPRRTIPETLTLLANTHSHLRETATYPRISADIQPVPKKKIAVNFSAPARQPAASPAHLAQAYLFLHPRFASPLPLALSWPNATRSASTSPTKVI